MCFRSIVIAHPGERLAVEYYLSNSSTCAYYRGKRYIIFEFHGKMKVDIFQHFGSKLPQKRPLLSILPLTTINPLFQPLKISKIQKKITKTHTLIINSYLIKNWGCYLKIKDAKSLGIFMFNKSVTSKFLNTLPFSRISAIHF